MGGAEINTATQRQPADLSATYRFQEFEKIAHNRGVLPEHVPALWQKYVNQVRRAGEWAMSGAMMTAVDEYKLAGEGDFLLDWLNIYGAEE